MDQPSGEEKARLRATRLQGGLLEEEPVVVVGLDHDLTIRFIEGRDAAGWEGQPVGGLLGDHAEEAESLARQALATGRRAEAIVGYGERTRHRLRITARPLGGTVVLVIADESHRRHRERAMDVVAHLLQGSASAITSVDDLGRFNSWNRGAEALFGYTAEEMIGKPVGVLAPADDSDVESLLGRVTDGTTVETVTTRRHKEGHLIQVSLTLTPVFDEDGTYLGASAILVDVTESLAEAARQEAMVRQLERSMHFAETFMGVLAHDLRNPLTAITTIAQVLGRNQGDARSQAAYERIVSSARRMSRMIDQLLDVTRLRLGSGLKLELAECDLAELCLDLIDELDDETSERGFEVSRTGDLTGLWDADRLGEALSNVLGNALEHGHKDEDVRVVLEGVRDDEVTLTVENARSIPPEVAATLFEPFTSASHKEPGKGLGLGLYISREILRAHGGELSYVPSDPHRSRFVLRLPRHAAGVARAAFED